MEELVHKRYPLKAVQTKTKLWFLRPTLGLLRREVFVLLKSKVFRQCPGEALECLQGQVHSLLRVITIYLLHDKARELFAR